MCVLWKSCTKDQRKDLLVAIIAIVIIIIIAGVEYVVKVVEFIQHIGNIESAQGISDKGWGSTMTVTVSDDARRWLWRFRSLKLLYLRFLLLDSFEDFDRQALSARGNSVSGEFRVDLGIPKRQTCDFFWRLDTSPSCHAFFLQGFDNRLCIPVRGTYRSDPSTRESWPPRGRNLSRCVSFS